jgi:hypothetical protein
VYSIPKLSNHKKDTTAAPYHNVLTNSWHMSAPLVAAHHLQTEFRSFCTYCLLHGFSPPAVSEYHWQLNFSSDQELMPCWQTTFFSPSHNWLCSRKAAAVVATAFTLTAVPITTSAVVAGTAADILTVAAVPGAAAALIAAADKVAAAVLAVAVISTAAAYKLLLLPKLLCCWTFMIGFSSLISS